VEVPASIEPASLVKALRILKKRDEAAATELHNRLTQKKKETT